MTDDDLFAPWYADDPLAGLDDPAYCERCDEPYEAELLRPKEQVFALLLCPSCRESNPEFCELCGCAIHVDDDFGQGLGVCSECWEHKVGRD